MQKASSVSGSSGGTSQACSPSVVTVSTDEHETLEYIRQLLRQRQVPRGLAGLAICLASEYDVWVTQRDGLPSGSKSDYLRNLRHSFLLCRLKPAGPAVLVDPAFRDQFAVAGLPPDCPYAACVAALPELFIGTPATVSALVNLMSDALARDAAAAGRDPPPWRSKAALASKWAPARFVDTLHAPPPPRLAVPLHPLLAAAAAAGGVCGGVAAATAGVGGRGSREEVTYGAAVTAPATAASASAAHMPPACSGRQQQQEQQQRGCLPAASQGAACVAGAALSTAAAAAAPAAARWSAPSSPSARCCGGGGPNSKQAAMYPALQPSRRVYGFSISACSTPTAGASPPAGAAALSCTAHAAPAAGHSGRSALSSSPQAAATDGVWQAGAGGWRSAGGAGSGCVPARTCAPSQHPQPEPAPASTPVDGTEPPAPPRRARGPAPPSLLTQQLAALRSRSAQRAGRLLVHACAHLQRPAATPACVPAATATSAAATAHAAAAVVAPPTPPQPLAAAADPPACAKAAAATCEELNSSTTVSSWLLGLGSTCAAKGHALLGSKAGGPASGSNATGPGAGLGPSGVQPSASKCEAGAAGAVATRLMFLAQPTQVPGAGGAHPHMAVAGCAAAVGGGRRLELGPVLSWKRMPRIYTVRPRGRPAVAEAGAC